MDRYEYQLKTRHIKQVAARKEFAEAAKLCDTIDWMRVRDVRMLAAVSDIYASVGRYEDAIDVLQHAYQYAVTGQRIVYRLAELELKADHYDEAKKYFEEFCRVAPTDQGRFILMYKMACSRNASPDEKIEILESYKKEDFDEKWAYRLAVHYAQSGRKAQCIQLCDDIIRWFGLGKYVEKALKLKSELAPLTPSQKDKAKKFAEEKRRAHNEVQKAGEETKTQNKAEDVQEMAYFETSGLQKELKPSEEGQFPIQSEGAVCDEGNEGKIETEETEEPQEAARCINTVQSEGLACVADFSVDQYEPLMEFDVSEYEKTAGSEAGQYEEAAVLEDESEEHYKTAKTQDYKSQKAEPPDAEAGGYGTSKNYEEDQSGSKAGEYGEIDGIRFEDGWHEQNSCVESEVREHGEEHHERQSVPESIAEKVEEALQNENSENSNGLNFTSQAAESEAEKAVQSLPVVNPADMSGVWHFAVQVPPGEDDIGQALDYLQELSQSSLHSVPDGDVVRISGKKMNQKGVAESLDKLLGKTVLIEEAGDMDERAANELSRILDPADHSLLAIFIDTPASIKHLLVTYPQLTKSVTAQFVKEEYSETELFEYARVYAEREDSVIDTSGELVLRERLKIVAQNDERNKLRIVEVIVNSAIQKAEQRSVRRLFQSKYNKNGCLILRDRDFS